MREVTTVADWLRERADTLADDLAAELAATLPRYGRDAGPPQQVVRDVCELQVLTFADVLDGGAPTDDDRLDAAVAAAARRAREGFELDDLLSAYRVGMRWIVGTCAARTDDAATVRRIADLGLAQLDHLSRLVAQAFQDARAHMSGTDERIHAELVDLLMAGTRPSDLAVRARRHGLPLAERYAVAVAADRSGTGALRSWGDALRLRQDEARVLVAAQAHTLLLLWPSADDLRSAIARRLTGWDVVVSLAEPVGPLPEQRRAAEQVLHLVGRDRTGVVTVDDVLGRAVRSQMGRPALVALDRLAARLEDEGRDDDPTRSTVRALVESDGSVVAAAESLGIHRNTLTYRMDRMRERTGRDPRRLADLFVLLAAVERVDADGTDGAAG